jgi:MFS family permease
MAFYSSTIFVESGFNQDQALYASIGFGALNFAFAIPAIFTIDTFGRRSLLLATFPNMAWTLFVAGGCLYIETEKVKLALVALFVYLFTIAYSVGEGPVPFMYSAEGVSFLSIHQNLPLTCGQKY